MNQALINEMSVETVALLKAVVHTVVCENLCEIKEGKRMASRKRIKHWREFVSVLSKYEIKFRRRLEKLFRQQGREVIANLKKVPKAYRNVKSLDFWSYSESEWKLKFEVVAEECFKGIMKDAGRWAASKIKGEFDFNDPRVEEFIKNRAKKMAATINDTTMKRLLSIPELGGTGLKAAGDPLPYDKPDPVAAAKAVFDSAVAGRAPMIARTESVNAGNAASSIAFQQSENVEGIEWITAEDEKVCDECLEMDGRVKDINDTFLDVGDSVMIGGDQITYDSIDWPPLHVNCRCSIAAVMFTRDVTVPPGQEEGGLSRLPGWELEDISIDIKVDELFSETGMIKQSLGGVDFERGAVRAGQAKDSIAHSLAEKLKNNEAYLDYAKFMEFKVQSEAIPYDSLYDSVDRTVRGWAFTSADNSASALALQLAAQEEFGLSYASLSHFNQSALETARDYYAKWGEALRAFVRAQYELTQEYFAAQGITEVTVMRGMRYNSIRDVGSAFFNGKAESVAMSMQPMSSFTTNSSTALEFVGGSKGSGKVVVMVKVPVNRLVASCRSGFGCLSEQEVVLLGGKKEEEKFLKVAWNRRKENLGAGDVAVAFKKFLTEGL